MLSATPLAAQSWSPAPLATATPIPEDGLPATRAAFWRWVTDSAESLAPEQVQSARERVFSYVSQYAKATGGVFPAVGDSAAAQLFAAAAFLGITGSDQLFRAVVPDREPGEALPLPPGLLLAFEKPVFQLASDDHSWAVCFPYYFMPTLVGRQKLGNGVVTEVAILSTLFAPDSGSPGSSQATLMIAAAPIGDSTAHLTLLLGQLGVKPDPAAGPRALGRWFSSTDRGAIRRQVVVRKLRDRIVLLSYSGLRGTYEANRPHFLDVVRTLGAERCAR